MRHPVTGNRPHIHYRWKSRSRGGQKLWNRMIRSFFALVVFLFCFSFCEFRIVREKPERQSEGSVAKSLSGLNFITGSSLPSLTSEGAMDALTGERVLPNQMLNVSPDAWAILALGAAILGLSVAQDKKLQGSGIFTGLAVAGLLALLIFQSSVSKYEEEIKLAAVTIRTEMSLQFGYWCTLWAFAVAGILSAWKPGRQKAGENESEETPPPIQINITEQWWN